MSSPQPSAVNPANALTVLRIVLVPVFAWMLLSHPSDIYWRLASTAVFGLAIATDALDRRIARQYNLITDFGKIWDSIADKALTGMAFVGLSILGELPWWITLLVLIREWGITWMRVAMLKYGVMAANRGGKLKTVLQHRADPVPARAVVDAGVAAADRLGGHDRRGAAHPRHGPGLHP